MTAAATSNVTIPRALAERDPNTVAAQLSTASPTEPSAKQSEAASLKPAGPEKAATAPKKRKSDTQSETHAPDQQGGDEETTTGAKKRKTTTGTRKSDGAAAAKRASSAKDASSSSAAEALLDVSSVTLPGEDDGVVPVYETCDGVRRRIRDLLKKDGVTQAGFCRALGRSGGIPDEDAPPPRQLSRFMEKKGSMKGNTHEVFYASYVLLEKMRIRDGKAKGKFRMEMEEKYGERGVMIDSPSDCFVTLRVGDKASWDRYGVFQMKRKPTSQGRRVGYRRVRCG